MISPESICFSDTPFHAEMLLRQLHQLHSVERRGSDVHFRKPAPFASFIFPLLGLIDSTQVEVSALPFLAWMLMRKRNPFFDNGTGWEGYAVAHTLDAGNAFEWLLQVGTDIIARTYRLCPNLADRKAMYAILDGNATFANLRFWNGIFGAALAELRMQTLRSPVAREYRQQTYDLLPPTAKVRLLRDGVSVEEQYFLPQVELPGIRRIDLQQEYLGLPDAQKLAVQILELLGRLGHPSVRVGLFIAQNEQSKGYVLPKTEWQNETDWRDLQLKMGRKVS